MAWTTCFTRCDIGIWCEVPPSMIHNQVRWLPREVGVREGRDERDRRPRHPPLLRLTLPHGTGETEGATTLKISVLLFNVGPLTFGNLSDICQKSVRKLSVTKMCQKTVLNVSEFCQKTVRCKYLSEIYQKRFGNPSEMCQIL